MSYNPNNGTVSNKPYSPAQPVPTDGRSWFYDAINFVYRPFQNTSEVLAYFDTPTKRVGHYSIWVNEGGTLNAGIGGLAAFTGGIYKEYSFIQGVADTDLVPKNESKYVFLSSFPVDNNGVVDSSIAFQSAVNLASSSNKTLIIGQGTYKLLNVQIPSNTTIIGLGNDLTTFIMGTALASDDFIIGCGMNTTVDTTGANNFKNIILRNISFRGTSDQTGTLKGFQEHMHCCSFNGVTNLEITGCKFYAFNGDGVYIGNGAAVEKHNFNVKINGCYFDGINHLNRNGISITDGVNINISDNYFYRCTNTTMPGAIDIEPDNNSFSVVQDIIIDGNHLFDIGGNVAAISMYIPTSQNTRSSPVRNINITNNKIINLVNSTASGIHVATLTECTSTTIPHEVRVTNNNIENCRFPLQIYGICDGKFKDNTFKNAREEVYVGLNYQGLLWNCYNIEYTNNEANGNSNIGVGVVLNKVTLFNATGNIFKNIGFIDVVNGAYGVCYVLQGNGNTSQVFLKDDIVIAGTVTTGYSTLGTNHTTTPTQNIFRKGYWSTSLVNQLPNSGDGVDKRFTSGKGVGTAPTLLIGSYPIGLSYTVINNPSPETDLGWPERQGIVITYYDNVYGADGIGYGWQEYQSRVVSDSTTSNNAYMRRWYRQPANFDANSPWGAWKELLLTDAGPTAKRPSGVTAALFIGKPFFDTDLGRMIWWNGTTWSDPLGTIPTILSGTATLDFASTPANTSSELTTTITGAAVGDLCRVSSTINPANSTWSAYVSAVDTITVRFNNYSLTAIDPASGTFKIQITK